MKIGDTFLLKNRLKGDPDKILKQEIFSKLAEFFARRIASIRAQTLGSRL